MTFTVFNISIPYYGFFLVLGLLVAMAVGYLLTKKHGIMYEDLIILVAYALVFGFTASKLFYLALNVTAIDWSRVVSDASYRAQLVKGGFVFFAGIVGGYLGLLAAKKFHKIDAGYIMSVVIPIVPIAHGFGRIGCHFAGCCYGVPFTSPISVTYGAGHPCAGVQLFPMQITEAIGNFVIAILLYVLFVRRHKITRRSILAYILMYSVFRFMLEFLRGDAERGKVLILSTSQLIGIVLIAVVMIIWKKTNWENETFNYKK